MVASRSTRKASSKRDLILPRRIWPLPTGHLNEHPTCSKPHSPVCLPLATCAAATSNVWHRPSEKAPSQFPSSIACWPSSPIQRCVPKRWPHVSCAEVLLLRGANQYLRAMDREAGFLWDHLGYCRASALM